MGSVLPSNLIRWSGLVAMVAAVLFVIADLVALFAASFQGPSDGIIIQNVLAVGAGMLLLLGLVALYGRHVGDMGTPGLVVFLITFVGLALALGAFIWASLLADQGWVLFFVWASLLANLGWILFGGVILEAQIYPRAAAVLIGVVVLYGVANALVGSAVKSGVLVGGLDYVMGAVIFNIVFNVAIALLGLIIVKGGRNQEAQPPPA